MCVRAFLSSRAGGKGKELGWGWGSGKDTCLTADVLLTAVAGA